MGRTIRIRRDISIQIQKLRLLNKEHENVHGKDMTNDEMAEAMDMTEEEVAELLMLEDRSSTTSLNKVLYSESDRQEESDKELNGAIDDPTAQVEERALDKVIEDTIIKEVHSLLAISTLDERSKEIVRMQFGIGYEKPMSLREIHKQVVGRFETISMLASAAIEHLRSEAALFEMDRLLDADSE